MTWPTPPQQQHQAPQQQSGNYNDLLGGGKSIPTASFQGQFPIVWQGVVLEAAKRPAYEYDPSKPGNRGAQKFWPDGNPVEDLWITLQTEVRTSPDDDGRRVLVLDSKNKLTAVQDAVRESGADFEKGGRLLIEWYGVDPNGKNPQNPPKLYRARYQGPTLNAALGQAAQAPQAAPAPQGQWGQPAPSGQPAQQGWGQAPAPASPAPATGGWGSPAPQPAPAKQGQFDGQWGAAQPAPAAPQIDPGLLAALQARGIDTSLLTSQQHAEQVAATLGLTRG